MHFLNLSGEGIAYSSLKLGKQGALKVQIVLADNSRWDAHLQNTITSVLRMLLAVTLHHHMVHSGPTARKYDLAMKEQRAFVVVKEAREGKVKQLRHFSEIPTPESTQTLNGPSAHH